jgi:hypothetical protein
VLKGEGIDPNEPYYYQTSFETSQAGVMRDSVPYGSKFKSDRRIADGEIPASRADLTLPARSRRANHEIEKLSYVEPRITAPVTEQTVSDGPVIVIQPVLPATGEGEKIIRTAQARLEVQDGKDAYQKLGGICQAAGGYVASSNLARDNDGRISGHISMRVPQGRFTEVLDTLRDFGQVKNITTNSVDVSQEYKNLKTRLDATMVVYNKMLEALKQRKNTIDQAAQLESELTPVLSRVEALKTRLEALDNQVSYTTITVYFFEPRVSLKLLTQGGQAIQESAITALFNLIKFLAMILPTVIAWVVAGLLLVGLGLTVKGWIIRMKK